MSRDTTALKATHLLGLNRVSFRISASDLCKEPPLYDAASVDFGSFDLRQCFPLDVLTRNHTLAAQNISRLKVVFPP